MSTLDLLQNEVTKVPIEYRNEESFRKVLFTKLDGFEQFVNSSSDFGSPFYEDNADFYKGIVTNLVGGLKETINRFYEGKPAQAYEVFSETMLKIDISEYLDKQCTIESRRNFYRLRATSGNYPLTREELFHIPFQKRGLVQSQRFSIPGLPSLYVSNSVYVAWEEMRRPNIDSIQAVRLVNTRQLKLLDITTDIYTRKMIPDLDSIVDPIQLVYKLLIWPLVACCSVKVKSPTDTFKPEYIVPQILLQWTSKTLDGIKYSSTHIDLSKNMHSGQFYNIVLPVKTFDCDSGHCENLKSLFDSTSVLPMQLRQMASITDRFGGQPSISTDVNTNIGEISLIEGAVQYYSQTSFGVLEHALRYMQPIPFE